VLVVLSAGIATATFGENTGALLAGAVLGVVAWRVAVYGPAEWADG
jgi:hypothetical protein